MITPSRTALAFALAVALAIPALALAGQEDTALAISQSQQCGDQPQPGAGWGNVRARNVGCGAARRVARRFWETRDETFDGWECKTRPVSDELWKARCKRARRDGLQRVKFDYGA